MSASSQQACGRPAIKAGPGPAAAIWPCILRGPSRASNCLIVLCYLTWPRPQCKQHACEWPGLANKNIANKGKEFGGVDPLQFAVAIAAEPIDGTNAMSMQQVPGAAAATAAEALPNLSGPLLD